MNQIKYVFGMKEGVTQKPYIFWGFGLLILKYLGEIVIYYIASSKILTPFEFLSPLITARYPGFNSFPDWFLPAVVLWSLPFIWIGVGMSIRRAADANQSPWLGIWFFVPGANYILMALLSFLPSSEANRWQVQKEKFESEKIISPVILSAVFGLCGATVAYISTNFLGSYANSLFLGSPLILGLVLSYLLKTRSGLNLKKSVGYVVLSILFIFLFLLLFALEGLICLAMALPIALALAIIGAVLGNAIATYCKPNATSPALLLLILPIMPFVESHVTDKTFHDSVVSTIEISALPDQVWPNVVKFSDLPLTNDWLFKLGVAYPVRAQISGEGVGAVRRCEFSTGAFIEPITTWDSPNRLAFNVQFQPPPMKELSFYDTVNAPHLNGYFRSVKGEFRLIASGNGKTILQGRTWYDMDIQPGWYWQFYGRYFIHKIHLRVLDHIKNLSEEKSNS